MVAKLAPEKAKFPGEIIPHSRPTIDEVDLKAVSEVLRTGMIAEGELVHKFEQEISNYLGIAGGIAISSGSSALFLALLALGASAGKEAILPTYVCSSVLDAVNWAGATPVLCDVGDDWCMNLDTVKPYISEKTVAIIVAHIFGISADVKSIAKLGIPVIEDCAQSLGGQMDGQKLGTFGSVCVCSFHATKLLTTGEGGMVLTKDPRLLDKLRQLKYGEANVYRLRYKTPMTDIQAALGLSQVQRYDGFLERRREIANTYFVKLNGLPIQLPENIRDRSIFFRFPLRVKGDFEKFRKAFEAYGVHVRRGVDKLLHRQLGLDPTLFPRAELCFKQTVSIPLYPSLSEDDIKRIIRVCYKVFEV